MGDVFDAMQRAKGGQDDARAARRSGGDAESAPSKEAAKPRKIDTTEEMVAASRSREEQPGLPIDEAAAAADAAAVRDGEGPVPTQPQNDSTEGDALAHADRKPAKAGRKAASNAGSTAMPARRGDQQAFSVPAPKSLNGYSREIIVHHDRGSIITEQYRAIRTQILARSRNRKLQTHVVTSSAPEEGKSVSSINLALSFAELRNMNTVVIECDLRRPSFAKLFDREAEAGMLQVLRGEMEVDEVLQPTVYDNMQFIPAGGRDNTQSTQLLSSPRMSQVIEQLCDRYDHVFIDTPPVITVTDPCIVGAMADEVLLVVRLNKTPTDIVDRAKRLLRASNCDIAGVILTHMHHEMSDYKYNNYYYGRRK